MKNIVLLFVAAFITVAVAAEKKAKVERERTIKSVTIKPKADVVPENASTYKK